MKRIMVLMMVVGLAALYAGCGSKKNKVKGAEDGDTDTNQGTDGAGALEPEANTGPVEVPSPPKKSASSRNPIRYDVSLLKAYALPLSEDGACWDPCTKDTKKTLLDALPNLGGDGFASSAKALTTSIGVKGGKEALPDVYAVVDCGNNNPVIETNKTGSKDRLTAKWNGVSETLKLDPNDVCSISIWDADDDGEDEMIGATDAKIVKMAKEGNVLVSADSSDFGQVVSVELFIEPLDAQPSGGNTGSGSGNTGSGSGNTGSGSGNSGSNSGGNVSQPPDSSGNANYYVEVVKANLKAKKSDGQPWDVKLPFVGKAGDEGPDPYVSAYVNGYKSENPFFKTNPAENSNYKEWRQGGNAKLNAGDKIHFMVWDKDAADNDLIGECISDSVGSLPNNSEITIRNCGQVDFLVYKIVRK